MQRIGKLTYLSFIIKIKSSRNVSKSKYQLNKPVHLNGMNLAASGQNAVICSSREDRGSGSGHNGTTEHDVITS